MTSFRHNCDRQHHQTVEGIHTLTPIGGFSVDRPVTLGLWEAFLSPGSSSYGLPSLHPSNGCQAVGHLWFDASEPFSTLTEHLYSIRRHPSSDLEPSLVRSRLEFLHSRYSGPLRWPPYVLRAPWHLLAGGSFMLYSALTTRRYTWCRMP